MLGRQGYDILVTSDVQYGEGCLTGRQHFLQDGVMRQAVQLERKGEGNNAAMQLQSLQDDIHCAVMDGM